MPYFVGILDGSGDVWGVRVPDFPGVHGGGSSPEAAITDATSALREVAEINYNEGAAIPSARGLQEVLAEVEAGEAAVLLPLVIERGRSVRTNISMDAGALEMIDAEAGRRGITRSAFLVSAAIEKIERGAA